MGLYPNKGILVAMRNDNILATRKVSNWANPTVLGSFLKEYYQCYQDFIALCYGVNNYIGDPRGSYLLEPRMVNGSNGIPKTETILRYCRLSGIDHLYARGNQQSYYRYLYLPNVKTDDFLESLKTAKKIKL